MRHLVSLACLLALAACGKPVPPAPAESAAPPASAAAPAPPPSAALADSWVGKWIGVEGNYIDIAEADDTGHYTLNIQTLDGLETHEGTAVANGIAFDRNGKLASIHAGTGDETGLKYLAGKTNCLIIEKGEGFCR